MPETPNALRAKLDYWNMGPQRSIIKLFEGYKKKPKSKVPTHRKQTLRNWSVKHNWQRFIIQKELEVEKAKLEELKDLALQTGYAVYYKRIHDLSRMADKIFVEIFEEDRHWLQDVKQIGSGDDAERVDIERFNASIIQQWRGMLDDLAKEMGEREKNYKVDADVRVTDIEAVRQKRWEQVSPALAQVLEDDDEDSDVAE